MFLATQFFEEFDVTVALPEGVEEFLLFGKLVVNAGLDLIRSGH